MTNSRSTIRLRSWALAFAVALSPAFLQTGFSCDRGDTYLLSLVVEESGQDQIVGFNVNNRNYAIAVDTDTVFLSTVTRDPGSSVTYQWIVNGATVDAGDLGVGGGAATVDVPPGQSTLRISVRPAPPNTAIGAYIVDVDGPDPVVPLTAVMAQNVTNQIFLFPYNLNVIPTSPIYANQSFTADLGGTMEFTEDFLDWLQLAVPGGLADFSIEDFNATVQTRGGGATGADVALGWDSSAVPFECFLVPGPCDPANDNPDGSNSDCSPVVSINTCQQAVEIPTSIDCALGGACAILGKSAQCTDNGFCVTSSLLVPLQTVSGVTYMAGDGVTPGQTEALFGWADTPPPATAVNNPPIDPDGTWNMVSFTSYTGTAGELGIAMNANGLFLAFEGVMGVDSNGPGGVGVPGDGSPAPDWALVSFPVTQPPASCDITETSCQSGTSCYPTGSGDLCLPTGSGAEDSVCTLVNDCDSGLGCVSIPTDPSPTTYCRALCDEGLGIFCAGGDVCVDLAGASAMAACLLDTCDLFSPVCPAGAGCYPTGYGDVCWYAGAGVQDDSCTDYRDCAAGLTCIDVAGPGTGLCLEICDLVSPVCPAGYVCAGTSDPSYGVCFQP